MTESSAVFSLDGDHRYWLVRRWDIRLVQFTYVLLNPSKADGEDDDATVTRLIRLTAANGGGGFDLVNLFSVVDTKQVGLHLPAAIGAENQAWLARVVVNASKLVLGWGDGDGSGPNGRDRQEAVRRRAQEVWPLFANKEVWCFRSLKSGAPGHPVRLNSACRLVRYRPHDYPY
jgi:hypothetical protein